MNVKSATTEELLAEVVRERDTLRRMVARMKPVVEAAVAWRGPDACGYEHDSLVAAVDDYEAGL